MSIDSRLEQSGKTIVPESERQKRIASATQIIGDLIPSLDRKNIKGIVGFGSFWSTTATHHPHDIDLAVYVKNGSEFIHDDKPKLVNLLEESFRIPVEVHLLMDLTNDHISADYGVMLRNSTYLWGKMPSWLEKK